MPSIEAADNNWIVSFFQVGAGQGLEIDLDTGRLAKDSWEDFEGLPPVMTLYAVRAAVQVDCVCV